MQVTNNTSSTTFKRITFTDKAVKEAFYKKLNDKRTYNKKDHETALLREHFCKFILEKEANRHERNLKIGMTKIKGKNVFTCQDEPLIVNKDGRQSFFLFITGLFLLNDTQFRKALTNTILAKLS